MSPSLYSRSFCDVEAEAFQLVGGCSMDGEVCLLSSMCRKLGGQEEDEGGGREVCLGHSGCVVLERGSWDVEQRSPLRLVTPGSGRARPSCSLWHLDPDTSTHLWCRRTWGMESPEWGNTKDTDVGQVMASRTPGVTQTCINQKKAKLQTVNKQQVVWVKLNAGLAVSTSVLTPLFKNQTIFNLLLSLLITHSGSLVSALSLHLAHLRLARTQLLWVHWVPCPATQQINAYGFESDDLSEGSFHVPPVSVWVFFSLSLPPTV